MKFISSYFQLGFTPVRALRTFALGIVALALSASAWAQTRLIPIPPNAIRAEFTFDGSYDIVANGRERGRMSPGVRITDRNNMLLMPGALNGRAIVKFTIEEPTSLVNRVWILTEEEIATPEPRRTQ